MQCPWIYPDLETALKGMLSAGPVERVIRATNLQKASAAIAEAIEQYGAPSGACHLDKFV